MANDFYTYVTLVYDGTILDQWVIGDESIVLRDKLRSDRNFANKVLMYLYSLGYAQSFGYAEDYDEIDPYDIYDIFMDEIWNEYQDNADFLIIVGVGIEVYTTVKDVSDVNSSRKSKASRTVYANSGVSKFYKQGDECTFQPNQEEYKLLEELADTLMELSPNGFKYWVADTYLDYGSKWMWTTVLAEDTISPYFPGTYQAISPAEWLALMNGEDITEIARHVLLDKHCPDEIRSSRNLRSGKPICSSRRAKRRK